MRPSDSFIVILLGLALTAWSPPGRTQSERDFVFADEEGHLVVRFPGIGATGLDSWQADEILNAEFSSMVHDRLRADLQFEVEPRDPDWARSMEPQLEDHVERAGPEFSRIFVECRTASCRIIMEESTHSSLTQHRAVLETVQGSLEAFIATHAQHFEPVFMITAYDQERETPHIKAFLRRTGWARRPARPGY